MVLRNIEQQQLRRPMITVPDTSARIVHILQERLAIMKTVILSLPLFIRASKPARAAASQHAHLLNGLTNRRHPAHIQPFRIQLRGLEKSRRNSYLGEISFLRQRSSTSASSNRQSVEEFATARDRLRDRLELDCLVVGLVDKQLSEKLQLDADLTLEKALMKACQSEAVKRQQSALHSQKAKEHNIDRVQCS
ncbi:hypothetical protein HPB48_000320 [Haemaphysalis longicornis]|uniref:Uncharacterized protein n=1 Tax=Haemaphysalis longicornis TaxID=44386 RepID=A0A9J6G0L7_HAELO|nr:hypothetical protein HPB48_000320 [Haemaphysalis longicornis]